MRPNLPLVAALAFAALLVDARPARADADPALGYVFGSYAAPYDLAVKASKPTLLGGSFETSKHFGARPKLSGLEALGFGAGIGYDGWNVQLDVRSALSATAGTITGGYRLNLQFGNIELWTRLGIGPSLVLDYKHPTDTKRSAAGGIQSMAEVGVDYFFWKDTMAVGLKGVAAPSYSWPATFAADFAVNAGLRIIL